MAANIAQFKKGNQVSVGNPGPSPRPRIITNTLISQLNEIDSKTNKARVHRLVEKLINTAINDGEQWAFEMIFERIEGKVATIAPDGEVVRPGGPTLMFSFPGAVAVPGDGAKVVDATPAKKERK